MQTYSHAPRYSRSRRRRARKTPKLVILAVIFLAAVALRLIFPHFSRAIGDRVAAFFDYRSAIAVLGEGISGKRAFIDALGDAWSVAFHPGSGAAPVFGGEDASPPPNATQDPSPNPSNDANPAADFSDAVTAGSFDDAQWGDIPGGTLIL